MISVLFCIFIQSYNIINMLKSTLFQVLKKRTHFRELFYSTSKNPLNKTWNVLRGDIKSNITNEPIITYPEHADILIIGGGFIGSFIAYWLKQKAGEGLSVVILDKDISLKGAQQLHSFNAISRHFSLPENIMLSQFSVDFLRNIKKELGKDVDIQFTPHNFLLLASEAYADRLEQNVDVQKEHGIINKLLTTKEIQEKYPWIDTSDIKLGCTSVEGEGTFNSWALLKGLVNKCKELGVTYVEAEVMGFKLQTIKDMLMEGAAPGTFKKISHAQYRTNDNEMHDLKFSACIAAAGADTSDLAKLADIGTGSGLLEVALPVEKRHFKVYSAYNQNTTLSLNTPFVMDTSGMWFRKNGLQNNLICSQLPPIKQETGFTGDEYYKNIFMPSLLNRLPNYKDAEIQIISDEIYDCNTFDDTGILGPHVYHNNLYFASGFGRYGIQHSPGIGRAIAELIIDSQFLSIDLTRFGFDRVLIDEPVVEFNVY